MESQKNKIFPSDNYDSAGYIKPCTPAWGERVKDMGKNIDAYFKNKHKTYTQKVVGDTVEWNNNPDGINGAQVTGVSVDEGVIHTKDGSYYQIILSNPKKLCVSPCSGTVGEPIQCGEDGAVKIQKTPVELACEYIAECAGKPSGIKKGDIKKGDMVKCIYNKELDENGKLIDWRESEELLRDGDIYKVIDIGGSLYEGRCDVIDINCRGRDIYVKSVYQEAIGFSDGELGYDKRIFEKVKVNKKKTINKPNECIKKIEVKEYVYKFK